MIAAVIVTYNRVKMLQKCLDSLLQQTAGCDILIIDNASTDSTAEVCFGYTAEHDNIQYFNTGANLGGAGGFQYGMRTAVEQGYDYVWVMDDDCYPDPDALEELMQADRKLGGEYGFLSSKVVWTDGTPCQMNIQRYSLSAPVEKEITEDLTKIRIGSFVSMLIRAEAIRKAGLPIKEFFIWTDDWEYSLRLSKDSPGYLVKSSRVTHACANNIPANIWDDQPERFDRYRYRYRNDVYLYRKAGLHILPYAAARIAKHIVKVIFCAKSRKAERIGIILQGTARGFRFSPAIEYCDK